MVCFKYIILNILHKIGNKDGDDDNDYNSNNNNNNNKQKWWFAQLPLTICKEMAVNFDSDHLPKLTETSRECEVTILRN